MIIVESALQASEAADSFKRRLRPDYSGEELIECAIGVESRSIKARNCFVCHRSGERARHVDENVAGIGAGRLNEVARLVLQTAKQDGDVLAPAWKVVAHYRLVIHDRHPNKIGRRMDLPRDRKDAR